MVTKQNFMRMMKIIGGVTHGRGIITDSVLMNWLRDMPVATKISKN